MSERESAMNRKKAGGIVRGDGRAGTGDPARGAAGGGRVHTRGSWRSTVREYARAILMALFIALLVRQFAFQAFRIPSGSMRETLMEGDFLFVNKFLYGATTPKRLRVLGRTLVDHVPYTSLPALRQPRQGDIIVFEWPEDPSQDYIKRTVAAAGDRLEVRDGVLAVNGAVYESNFGDRDGDHSCIPDPPDPDVCPPPRSLRMTGGWRPSAGVVDTRWQFGLWEGLMVAQRRAHHDYHRRQFGLVARAALDAGVFPDPERVRPHVEALHSAALERRDLPYTERVRHEQVILAAAEAHELPYVVPAGHIFMMGDNRFNSQDSRVWGALDTDLIRGKAEFIYFSFDWDRKLPRIARVGDIIR
ncbi:MAG: signal peptidase I [Candidatus Krumholzibacteriia bacterium]